MPTPSLVLLTLLSMYTKIDEPSLQMTTQKLLDEETECNRDNIAHCEALQKHYDDRVSAYEVHYFHRHHRLQ